jgi:hypothetical protein
MSLGQHEHRVVLRWRLQPLITDQLFCSGSREGAAMALVWTPIETMFFGVLGIVRCTIMLSQYTGMARVGGCGAWISSSIIMWKDHW